MLVDDRTEEELETHTFVVGGHDPHLSGWGQAPGRSFAYWACSPDDAVKVESWVRETRCLNNVYASATRTIRSKAKRESGRDDHHHIYVVRSDHGCLKNQEKQ